METKAVIVDKMPENCEKCLLFDDDFIRCIPLDKDLDLFVLPYSKAYLPETGRPDWCPLRAERPTYDDICTNCGLSEFDCNCLGQLG